MAKKRGNGEGSIYKDNKGRWRAEVTIGRNEVTGKPKRKTFYGKTREEVKNKLIAIQGNLLKGTYIEPSKITLADWLDTWLYDLKKNSVRPTTFTSYEYLTRDHIKPELGDILLKDLKASQIQNLLKEKLSSGRTDGKGGLSSRTVRYIYVALHDALEKAVKNELIIRNPANAVTLPKQSKKEIKILSVEDELKLINTVKSDRLGAAFILDLATGIRLGELLALRWKDIDFDDCSIRICQSISRIKVFDEDSPTKTKLIFQEPKTKSGKRSIPLPKSVKKELEAHRERQNEEKKTWGVSYNDNDLVFCAENGQPIDHRNFKRKFDILLKAAKIDHINLHALRHTYATRLLELNEHPKVVQEILGHSSIAMTLDIYSHVLPEVKKSAAAKIDNLFSNENDPSVEEESSEYKYKNYRQEMAS